MFLARQDSVPSRISSLSTQTLRVVQQPPISCINQVLRSELLPYYYKTKTELHYKLWCGEGALVEKWLRAIGPVHGSLISGFKVQVFRRNRLEKLREYVKDHWTEDDVILTCIKTGEAHDTYEVRFG